MSAEINTIDGPMKPAERQECAVCKGSKRLVWVYHDGTLKVAIKCKCGLGLYNWHKEPSQARKSGFKDDIALKKDVVLGVVRECEKESREPVRQASLEVICAGMGIFPSQTAEILAELKADGAIYDPERNGRYKVV